ncbi:MAG: hypothetical protein JW791_03560 [Nanoarchaeota archaeon]|nr:hypothetical protein [Nanoarchaeota archaeon]
MGTETTSGVNTARLNELILRIGSRYLITQELEEQDPYLALCLKNPGLIADPLIRMFNYFKDGKNMGSKSSTLDAKLD